MQYVSRTRDGYINYHHWGELCWRENCAGEEDYIQEFKQTTAQIFTTQIFHHEKFQPLKPLHL